VGKESQIIETAYLFVSDTNERNRRKVPGIDLTKSLISWIEEVKKIQNVCLVSDAKMIKSNKETSVAVFSYDWISKDGNWKMFCYEIWRTGIHLRRNKIPAWVFVADVFAQEHAFPISLLVALSGGAIIIQSNTSKEAELFGLVHPVGPIIWTITPSILNQYSSDRAWANREKVALIANSGEKRRINAMSALRNKLEAEGFGIQTSNHQLDWSNYLEILGNVKVVATTNWVQAEHKIGTKKLKKRISEYNVTHRVWDGFAAGSVVITNNCLTLQALGILPGTHFIELDEILLNHSKIPETKKLNEIVNIGHVRFCEIVTTAG
jgi:hypothetical protein